VTSSETLSNTSVHEWSVSWQITTFLLRSI